MVLELSALAVGVSLMTSVLIAGMVVVPVRRWPGPCAVSGRIRRACPALILCRISRAADEIGELSEALRDMLRQLLRS